MCVYFPWSSNNLRAEKEGRPYSHALLYLGKVKGKHWVVHNAKGPRIETIEQALSFFKGNGSVVEIIQPRKN